MYHDCSVFSIIVGLYLGVGVEVEGFGKYGLFWVGSEFWVSAVARGWGDVDVYSLRRYDCFGCIRALGIVRLWV